MPTHLEIAREVPIVEEFDVIVCGGGPAGIAAAIAAARNGAKTALLEVQGCPGGVWTSGTLSWIMDGKFSKENYVLIINLFSAVLHSHCTTP